MFELLIGKHRLSSPQDFENAPDDLKSFEKEAFGFCKDWLSDKQSFELQTSGSTGTPKLIQVSREQMESSALATGAYLGINPGTELLCCMNTAYIAGKMMLVRAMVWRCPILVIEPSSKPFANVPSSFHPKFVAMVPLQVEASIISHPLSLQKLPFLLIGGAPVSEKLQNKILDLGLNAFQSYGMTETVSHIAIAPYKAGDFIYETLPGVELGQDTRGAIWVKAAMSNNQKVQTNDLVEFVGENKFKWLGRADYTVNSGGIKLHPDLLERKIEIIVTTYFPESQFFLIGENDEKLGQKLVLVIEAPKNLEEKASLLHNALSSKLTKYELPKSIYLIEQFKRTPTGKIKRLESFELR